MAERDEDERRPRPLLHADGSNFYTWSKRMESKFIERGCFSAISPGFGPEVHDEPDEITAMALLDADQLRANKKARGLILDSVSSSIIYDIGEFQLAKKCWDTLTEMYGQFGIIHTMLFFKEMARLDKTPAMNMTEYISKMHELIQKVRIGGIELSDACFAAFLLLGLPLDTYDSFIRGFEGDLTKLNSRSVKGKLMMEERRDALKANASNGDNIALKASANPSPRQPQRSDQPKQEKKTKPKQDNRRNNNDNNNVPKSEWKCYTCNKPGHTARNCPTWLAFKEQQAKLNGEGKASFAKAGDSEDEGTVLLCAQQVPELEGVIMCAEQDAHLHVSQGGAHEDKWFLDSGASDHMCWDPDMFKHIDHSRKGSVKIGDGFRLQVEGIGQVEVQATSKITLSEVMYVPSLYCNLVSVHQITEKNVKLVFEGKQASASLNSKELFCAVKEKKMYVVNIKKAVSDDNQVSSALAATTLQDWHKRLGHICVDTLPKIRVLSSLKKGEKQICEVCVQGKLSRKPFPTSASRASKVLELVHTDLMGRFNPPTFGGSEYAIVFTDDHSRHVTVMPMKTKDEAIQKIKKYKTMMESLSGEKLTKIRSDFGGEYANHELDTYLDSIGVVHQKSVPHCPQQNGRSERQNRTLFEMARSMMAEAGANKRMWGEALSTAAYNRNRTPSRAIGYQVPLELVLKRKLELSEYEFMKPFGCRVQAMKEGQKNKIERKDVECVMLGYEEDTKDGYRLYNINTGKVIVRRDAKFHESEFPWKKEDKTNKQKSDYYPGILDSYCESEDESDGEERNQEEGNRENQERNEQLHEIPILPEDQEPPVIEEVIPVLRRSARTRKPKKCDCEANGCGSCLHCVAFAASAAFKNDETEPQNYKEATEGPKAPKWGEAMKEEINRLKELDIWTLCDRPQGKTVIGSTWKYKIKTNADGEIVKHKARLVAQGFAQKYGLDYHETYSPVVKRKTIRLMLALGVEKGWSCEHVDVISAYINSDIKEEVYIEQPEGFAEGNKKKKVCRLKKCLYGLKQSGMEWYNKIRSILTNMDFKPTYADPCLFINQERKLYVCLYVDDLAVWGEDGMISWFKETLNANVEIRELGQISDFLSMRISKLPDGSISLDQRAYVDAILEEFNLEDSKGHPCPLSSSVLNINNEDDGPCDQSKYRRAIGMILYVANGTRPDLSFPVSYLSQFLSSPKEKHMAAARHLMRYMKYTRDYCIVYRKCEGKLEIYSDADHANDKLDRKSFSGLVVLIAGGPVEWRCKKQTVVALSTQQAEYIAMAIAAQEALWLRNVFHEVGFKIASKLCIKADNTSALSLAQKDITDDRSKAIDIKYHFIKDCIKKGLVSVMYVASRDNFADILTKSLTGRKTQEVSARMGLIIP